MAPRSIIDSHIHLWPESMSNEESHAWMTPPEMPLRRQHILSDYYNASDRRPQTEESESDSDVEVEGVVYVETDVRYDKPTEDLKSWAKGPLDELSFLRAIVEGQYGERDRKTLVGIVAWAPLDQPTRVLEEWLQLAEKTAGPETWRRVKGFRFLLQFIQDEQKFSSLVSSEDFIRNLQVLGERGFSFDVGVDQHSGGVWQLEVTAKAMRIAHQDVPEDKKVVFVVNHLCKPDFIPDGPDFSRWCEAIRDMASLSKAYMKVSGAFSELPSEVVDKQVADIATHMRPWVEHVLSCFGSSRVMFGSDWPVCNVNGPAKEGSWMAWREVVTILVDHAGVRLDEFHKDMIWRGTAQAAYRLNGTS